MCEHVGEISGGGYAKGPYQSQEAGMGSMMGSKLFFFVFFTKTAFKGPWAKKISK